MDEPITDKVRGTLDGHIVLSRALAQERHYPAIDVLQSISRLSKRVSGKASVAAANKIARLIALYAQNAEMINAGVYQQGTNADIDESIAKHGAIEAFLTQEEYEPCPIQDTLQKLAALSEMEIPESEYDEQPALDRKTTAQMVSELAAVSPDVVSADSATE